ncbi:MAG: PEP-CTERM sorting domain-containing protein [Pseudomonadota bacterium]
MKKFASALLTGAAVMVMASTAHATFDLDTFDGTEFGPVTADVVNAVTTFDNTAPDATGVATPGGVDRLVTAIKTDGTNNLDVGINAGGNSVYSLDLGFNAQGITWLSYDLGALDLFNDETINAFAIEVVSVNVGATIGVAVNGDAPVALELTNTSSRTFGDGDAAETFYIPFDAFGDNPGNWVTLFIDSRNGVAADSAIDTFGVVCLRNGDPTNGPVDRCTPPTDVSEPGTVGLVGLGLIGLAAAARRRKA